MGPDSVIGDVTQAAYLGPWLWKVAAEKAGSFDIDKISAASPGIEPRTAPEPLRESPRQSPLCGANAHRTLGEKRSTKVVYEPA